MSKMERDSSAPGPFRCSAPLTGCSSQWANLSLNLPASGEMILRTSKRNAVQTFLFFQVLFFTAAAQLGCRLGQMLSRRHDTTPSSPSSRLWAAVAGSCVVKGVSLLKIGCCSALTTLNSVSGDVTNRCPGFVVKAACSAHRATSSPTLRTFFPLVVGSISSFF